MCALKIGDSGFLISAPVVGEQFWVQLGHPTTGHHFIRLIQTERHHFSSALAAEDMLSWARFRFGEGKDVHVRKF